MYICKEKHSNIHQDRFMIKIKYTKAMIFSVTGYLHPFKFVDLSFPQRNGVQSGWLSFTSLDYYVNLPEILKWFYANYKQTIVDTSNWCQWVECL